MAEMYDYKMVARGDWTNKMEMRGVTRE